MKLLIVFCFILTWLSILFASVIILAKYDRLDIRQDRLIRMLNVDEDVAIVHMKRVGK